jgi:hypothetical protein
MVRFYYMLPRAAQTDGVGNCPGSLYAPKQANKLAHGLDLRTAATDKTIPVDLLKQVTLTEFSEPTYYANLLSQAACFFLCRVLQQKLGQW